MRGADLLGLPVTGPDGEHLGKVLDARLVQDGPLLGAYAAFRLEGLVVGRRTLTARLGYDRVDAQGPWLIAAVVSWLLRDNRYLPWEELELLDGGVRSRIADLPPVPRIA